MSVRFEGRPNGPGRGPTRGQRDLFFRGFRPRSGRCAWSDRGVLLRRQPGIPGRGRGVSGGSLQFGIDVPPNSRRQPGASSPGSADRPDSANGTRSGRVRTSSNRPASARSAAASCGSTTTWRWRPITALSNWGDRSTHRWFNASLPRQRRFTRISSTLTWPSRKGAGGWRVLTWGCRCFWKGGDTNGLYEFHSARGVEIAAPALKSRGDC